VRNLNTIWLKANRQSSWRRHLQDGDVELLLDYRKEKMPHHYAKAIELNIPASTFIIKYMLTKGWSDEMFASIQTESMWLTRHVDLEKLAREERGGSAFTQRGEHWGDLPPDRQAFMHLLDAAEEPDITDFMKPYQHDDQWMRIEFPMPQPEPDITMETYLQNTWMPDSFPGIPVPTQQDHPQDQPPYRLVARVDNTQIDAVASSHTR
jgi:hypothetical protein